MKKMTTLLLSALVTVLSLNAKVLEPEIQKRYSELKTYGKDNFNIGFEFSSRDESPLWIQVINGSNESEVTKVPPMVGGEKKQSSLSLAKAPLAAAGMAAKKLPTTMEGAKKLTKGFSFSKFRTAVEKKLPSIMEKKEKIADAPFKAIPAEGGQKGLVSFPIDINEPTVLNIWTRDPGTTGAEPYRTIEFDTGKTLYVTWSPDEYPHVRPTHGRFAATKAAGKLGVFGRQFVSKLGEVGLARTESNLSLANNITAEGIRTMQPGVDGYITTIGGALYSVAPDGTKERMEE